MTVLTDYKGLDVVEGSVGSGGIALTDNFKELADRAPYQASANPGSSDDSTKGFSPGDFWLNTSTQVLWACVDSSAASAIWKSVLKRTATGLQLIPDESSELVQISGEGKVVGRLGVGRTATGAPLEVQQTAHGIGVSVFGTGTQAAEKAYLYLDSSGRTLLSGTRDIILNPGTGTTNVFGTRLAVRLGRYITFDDTAGSATGFSLGTSTTSGKLIIGTGSGLTSPKVAVDPSTGFVGIGTDSPGATLDVNGEKMRLRSAKTPSSASDTGNQGDICWDANYVYVCVAANTWKRAALASW